MRIPAVLQKINRSDDVVFIIDNKFILRGFNPAWEAFARANNGEKVLSSFKVGTPVLDAFPEPIKKYTLNLYRTVLAAGKRLDRGYECSSDRVYRKFRQSLYPLPGREGILISNHLEIEKPHPEKPEAFSALHTSPEGSITQCSHCRRIRNYAFTEKWDWIPEFIRNTPENVSHGLCRQCIDFYYPGILQ